MKGNVPSEEVTCCLFSVGNRGTDTALLMGAQGWVTKNHLGSCWGLQDAGVYLLSGFLPVRGQRDIPLKLHSHGWEHWKPSSPSAGIHQVSEVRRVGWNNLPWKETQKDAQEV